MTNQINDGGPAFPHLETTSRGEPYHDHLGMTLRQYAAIKLAVPDSGLPWLDEMIVKSNRERFAAAALQGMNLDFNFSCTTYAMDAYLIADAMLRAREVKP